MFPSRVSWMLLATHVFVFMAQMSIMLILDDPNAELNESSFAAFMAVQTRHAGFSIVNLARLHAGSLLVFCFCMFTSPTPLVIALENSRGRQRIASMLAREAQVARRLLDEAACRRSSAASTGSASRWDPAYSAQRLAAINDAEQPASQTAARGVNAVASDEDCSREATRQRLASALLATQAEYGTVDELRTAAANSDNEIGGSDDEDEILESHAMQRMIDTRLLLTIERARGRKVSWRRALSTNLRALRLDVMRAVSRTIVTPSVGRDATVVTLAWFILLCTFDGCATSGFVFYAFFETCSAVGNVGLSLGSLSNPEQPNVSFAADLNWVGKFTLMGVMLYGKCRYMPWGVDAAFTLYRGTSQHCEDERGTMRPSDSHQGDRRCEGTAVSATECPPSQPLSGLPQGAALVEPLLRGE